MSTGQGQRQLPGNQFDGTQDDIDSYGQIGDTSLKDDGSDTCEHSLDHLMPISCVLTFD